MKILIATPVFQLYSSTVAATLCQDWSDGTRDYALVQDDDLSLGHYARITAKFNRIRAMTLHGGYDALLVVEADMLPPPHALRCLLDTGADVAYGVYSFRHESMCGLWNVAATLHPEGHADWLMAYPEQVRALTGKVVKCQGVGLGTTLIRRHVLDHIVFRDNGTLHCDWFLGMDAVQHGFTQAAHLGVLCGHIQDKARAIWPDPSTDTLYRAVTPLEGF